MFKKVLVAFDGSDAARRGLATALALAADQRATLYVLHVLDGMPAGWSAYVDEEFRPARVEAVLLGLRVAGQRVLDEAQAMASGQGLATTPLLVDARGRSVAEVILAKVREIGADVVVLGTHGREGMSRLVMGSAAEDVLRHAEVPVLLVRAPVPVAASEPAQPVNVEDPHRGRQEDGQGRSHGSSSVRLSS
jgi:nucleotide-binding universal stress UspA family protein